MDDVSVIIVNYNGIGVLPRAVGSVLGLREKPRELIVVDNGSTDGSLQWLQTHASPLMRIVALRANHGVAGGRNAGVREARGAFIAFLDSDGEATDSWLPEAAAMLRQKTKAGAIAPLVLMEEGTVVNGAGSFLDASAHGRDRLYGEPLAMRIAEIAGWQGQPVDYPMGCGMVLRVRGLEKIWPLDDALPKWHDDTEIGIRVRKLGYQVLFNGASQVRHHPGHSDSQNRYIRQRLAETARLRLLWKYYPPAAALRGTAHYVFFSLTGARRRIQNFGDLAMVGANLLGSWTHLRQIRHQWHNDPTSAKEF